MQSEDVEALAVDFLSQVLWVVQTERFAVVAIQVAQCDETSAAAELNGEPYDPDRHELIGEIKAVTYHQLKVAREGGGWVGRVILDL